MVVSIRVSGQLSTGEGAPSLGRERGREGRREEGREEAGIEGRERKVG